VASDSVLSPPPVPSINTPLGTGVNLIDKNSNTTNTIVPPMGPDHGLVVSTPPAPKVYQPVFHTASTSEPFLNITAPYVPSMYNAQPNTVVGPDSTHHSEKPVIQILNEANELAKKQLLQDANLKPPVIKPYVELIIKLLDVNQALLNITIQSGVVNPQLLEQSTVIKRLRYQFDGNHKQPLLGVTMKEIGNGFEIAGKIVGGVATAVLPFAAFFG